MKKKVKMRKNHENSQKEITVFRKQVMVAVSLFIQLQKSAQHKDATKPKEEQRKHKSAPKAGRRARARNLGAANPGFGQKRGAQRRCDEV
jgi:hypothetical protein